MKCLGALLLLTAAAPYQASAFTSIAPPTSGGIRHHAQRKWTARTALPPLRMASDSTNLESSVSALKKVLEREYVSFFNPMRDEYYTPNVSFTDPMTTLSGVDSYRNNVDMLASRTLLGKVLFQDGGIALHNVVGGEVSSDGATIGDITTRWTLKVTVKILPWKPTAIFSGISVYEVRPTNDDVGVQIVHQTDYWDSINIAPNSPAGSGGEYQTVDKGIAVGHFLDQLKPGGFEAAAAGPELPYELLRKGDGYEVRRYPSFTGVRLPYSRRDEGFGSLGAFARGMDPLSPAVMDVPAKSDLADKYMMWPLRYAQPGQDSPPKPPGDAIDKAGEGQWRTMRVVTEPGKVVAVREFSDASMEPVVRMADRELRELLVRDGLVTDDVKEGSDGSVRFAQYDAIFSMGRRRGEVWIDLADVGGHPW